MPNKKKQRNKVARVLRHELGISFVLAHKYAKDICRDFNFDYNNADTIIKAFANYISNTDVSDKYIKFISSNFSYSESYEETICDITFVVLHTGKTYTVTDYC